MSIRKVHDARILNIVIPAKAGIHWLLIGHKMDSRLRGDDASIAGAAIHFGSLRWFRIGGWKMGADRVGTPVI